jgi:cyclopropane fatty-acyl-phospholipid synthase-like methyltransferase
MKVAIVGAGVSGLVCAHLLHAEHELTVFEAADYAGGHTNTVRVDTADETLCVDTGFIVFNDRNYPAFERLLQRLGVAWQPSTMSFGVSDTTGDFEYSSAPGDRVLEIGTGWGAFALHAAATRGCHVTTTTISREQHDYALSRVKRAGLEERVTVLMQDYRHLAGSYDKLVSIEMIEAVGWRHFGVFFAKCSELLVPDGAMLMQAITIDDRAYEVEKAAKSFINTRIFPGGCLPSLEVITHSVARRTDMQAIDLEDITVHYVETLRRWRSNFNASADELPGLGYDEHFRRLWTLYLYCEAGFAERRICGVQLMLAKPRWRANRSGPRLRSTALAAARGGTG